MNDLELSWLAGLLEGEGSFIKGSPSKPHSPTIQIEMTDEDVIKRVSVLFESTYRRYERDNPKWKPSFITRLTGKRAVRLMLRLHPFMGARRQEQIDLAVACYSDTRAKLTPDQAATIQTRALAGEKMQTLAAEYAVSYSTVKRLKYMA